MKKQHKYCIVGDIYRVWPCNDIDTNGSEIRKWPKIGKVCNQVRCKYLGFYNPRKAIVTVVSNEKLMDYTK